MMDLAVPGPANPHDIDYLLRRSAAEAMRSIVASDARAAAAHEEMCRRYVGLAVASLSGIDDARPAG
jgi:hypothetical protein